MRYQGMPTRHLRPLRGLRGSKRARSGPPGAPHDGEERGINAIVRRLITPAEVGILLCRADMARLGRSLGLPVAIGERFQILRSLFDSAGRFDQLPALLDALQALLGEAGESVDQLVAAYPAWAGHGRHWHRRIDDGGALIAEMRAQAGEYDPDIDVGGG